MRKIINYLAKPSVVSTTGSAAAGAVATAIEPAAVGVCVVVALTCAICVLINMKDPE